MLNRRQTLAGAGAVAGLAGAGAGGIAASQTPVQAVVSLVEQRNRFLVAVAVNGRPCRFVLDTGANRYFISSRLVSELGLRAVEQRMVRGYAGRAAEPVVAIPSLNVGGVEVGAARAVAWTPARLEEHDGLVGYSFLFPRASLALGQGRITLGQAAAGEAARRVPAEVSREQAVLKGGVDGAPGRFVLDTGSPYGTISADYHRRLRDRPAYQEAAKLTYRTEDGAAHIGAFRPARIAFGPFEIPQPLIRIDPEDGRQGVFAGGIDGLFGAALLRPYTWALDQAAGVLEVGAEPAPAPAAYYGSGVRLVRRGGTVVVAGVVEGGPADEAGLRPGQQVLSLSGAPDDRPAVQTIELIDQGRRRVVSLQTGVLI